MSLWSVCIAWIVVCKPGKTETWPLANGFQVGSQSYLTVRTSRSNAYVLSLCTFYKSTNRRTWKVVSLSTRSTKLLPTICRRKFCFLWKGCQYLSKEPSHLGMSSLTVEAKFKHPQLVYPATPRTAEDWSGFTLATLQKKKQELICKLLTLANHPSMLTCTFVVYLTA